MLPLILLAACSAPSPEFLIRVVNTSDKPQSGVLVQISADAHFRTMLDQGRTDKEGQFSSARFYSAPVQKEGEFAGLRVAYVKAVFSSKIESGLQLFDWHSADECPHTDTKFVSYPGGRRADVHPALRPDTLLVFSEVRRWSPDRKQFVSAWEGQMVYLEAVRCASQSSDGSTKQMRVSFTQRYDPNDPAELERAARYQERAACPCSCPPCGSDR